MLKNNRKIILATGLILTIGLCLTQIFIQFVEGLQVVKVGLATALFIVILLLVYVAAQVSKNLKLLISFFADIAQGKPPEQVKIVGENFNTIAGFGLKISENLAKASEFAQTIGEGDFSKAYEKTSEHDALGNSLIQMKEQLVKVAEREKLQNWVTHGLAHFGQLLRNSDDATQLSDLLLSELVKYMEANQGALYIRNKGKLQMISCYAYNRKKYLSKEIAIGEGLVGQSVLEQDYIHMSEIPQDYVNITSGLGKALPRELIVMPLKVNDEIHGVVELASFKKFEPHMIKFLEKCGENLASAIATFKVTERTKKLLTEADEQKAMMQAQEEMMRQTMEEMQSTHEELNRQSKEYQNRINEQQQEIEALKAQLSKEQEPVA